MGCVNEFLKHCNTINIEEINPKQIVSFYQHLQQRVHKKTQLPLSEIFISHHLYSLRVLFNWLQCTNQLEANPISNLKFKRPTLKPRQPLSQEEIKELFAQTENLKEIAILHLFYSCGLRRGEAVSLNITDIHFQQNILYIRNGKGAKRRAIPMTFKVSKELISSVITIAWPATFQFIIMSGSWIFLAKLVAETGGTEATAGYQIAFRNLIFFILPAYGMSNAAATLVGQNLGAKQIDRAEKSVMLIMKYNVIFMAFVTLLFFFFAENIIRIFTQDEKVIEFAVLSMQWMSAGYIFYGISMVMIQALNGAGDTKTPTVINIICFWCIQIPLAYLLAKTFDYKATGVFIAVPIAETLIALLAWYYFKKGRWKEIKI